jgi:hypothetical protein
VYVVRYPLPVVPLELFPSRSTTGTAVSLSTIVAVPVASVFDVVPAVTVAVSVKFSLPS